MASKLLLTSAERLVLADLRKRFGGAAFTAYEAYPQKDSVDNARRKTLYGLVRRGALRFIPEVGAYEIDQERTREVAF